jgi:hypothetical protein
LALYSDLLRRRHEYLVPCLPGARSGVMSQPAPDTLRITWPLGGGHRWHLLAQLSELVGPARLVAELPGEIIYRSYPHTVQLLPWSVMFALEVT